MVKEVAEPMLDEGQPKRRSRSPTAMVNGWNGRRLRIRRSLEMGALAALK